MYVEDLEEQYIIQNDQDLLFLNFVKNQPSYLLISSPSEALMINFPVKSIFVECDQCFFWNKQKGKIISAYLSISNHEEIIGQFVI